MPTTGHLAILKQGVEVWNKWRAKYYYIRPYLQEINLCDTDIRGANLDAANLRDANFYGMDLHEMELRGANLRGANLRNANLRGANLRNANLRGANLHDADLCNANLRDADFRDADLCNANLSNADLTRAIFEDAFLPGANFSNTKIGLTVFGKIDLSEVKGLDTVTHVGPSTIGIDTIYQSKGNIPEAFLRGAGTPDGFITFMKSLIDAAIDFYSCFISYAGEDQEFADRLYADLQAKGVRCWYAPHDIQGGKKIHEQIDQAIRIHDKLLLVLSEHSMDSEWVKTEIYKARQREVEEKQRKLFPISLVEYERVKQWEAFDADIGKDMAREVREYFIPDFTKWEHNSDYQKAFERLMRDLKAEG